MIRILIADDHFAVRLGLEMLVQDIFPEGTAIDFASNGLEVVEKITSGDYEVLLTDLNMPGIEGIPLIVRIRQLRPDLRILVISVNTEDFYAVRCLELGIHGFVHKGAPDEVLKLAIRTVCNGDRFLTDYQKRLIENSGHTADNPFLSLSGREAEVLNLLLKGYGILEISNALHISQSTASTFKSRILKKLPAASVIDLLRLAEQYGFNPDEAH